jgi:hypothetical protein
MDTNPYGPPSNPKEYFGRRSSAGDGLQYKTNYGGLSFEDLLKKLRANEPRFDPIDMSGLATLKERLAEADRLAKDPLSSPGAQQALQAINQGAARRAEFERGAAVGRGAATGANAFSGSLAQTAGDIVSRQNDAVTAMTGELANKLMQQYRAEGLSLSQAYAAAVNDISRLKNEQGKARTDWEAQLASILQRYDEMRYQTLLEQARLAENARQFDVLHPEARNRSKYGGFYDFYNRYKVY